MSNQNENVLFGDCAVIIVFFFFLFFQKWPRNWVKEGHRKTVYQLKAFLICLIQLMVNCVVKNCPESKTHKNPSLCGNKLNVFCVITAGFEWYI